MKCPECGAETLQVLDTRTSADGVRRRRRCKEGHRFSTQEVVIREGGNRRVALKKFCVDQAIQALETFK